MYCPNCGVAVTKGANFCSSCGERLDTNSGASPHGTEVHAGLADDKPTSVAPSIPSPSVWKLFGQKAVLAAVFAARVVALVVGIWQIIGLLTVLLMPSAYHWGPGTWMVVAIKLLILLVCFAIFFGL